MKGDKVVNLIMITTYGQCRGQKTSFLVCRGGAILRDVTMGSNISDDSADRSGSRFFENRRGRRGYEPSFPAPELKRPQERQRLAAVLRAAVRFAGFTSLSE